MKKFFAFFLVLLMTSSVAFAEEITFRGIEWGSNMAEIEKELEVYSIDDSMMRRWSVIEEAFDWAHMNDYPCGWYAFGMPKDLNVGGYDICSIQLFCAWKLSDTGEILREKQESEFYAAIYSFAVVDIEATYNDLKEKLSSLYGTPLESTESREGYYANAGGSGKYIETVRVSEWYGENNTGVRLRSCSSDVESLNAEEITISYGKTDADQRIERLQTALKAEALEKENASRGTNTDGL